MKALYFDKELKYIDDYLKPEPLDGEALIKVILAGICNTDLEIIKGYMNFKGIPGHEFVGVVEKINGDDKSLLNKRVVGDINCSCQKSDCVYCSSKLGRHCPERKTLGISNKDGCFAEYITLPLKNLYEVAEAVSNENAVFTEPLAAGFEILEQIEISPNKEILIVGDGKLGLLINHAISTTGAKITHVGKHQEKLDLIQSRSCKKILADQLNDTKFDITIEATGSISGFQYSVQHTKPRGTLVLKSTLAENQIIDLSPVVVNEITIVGSRCGLFPPALDYLSKGTDFSSIISNIFPLEDWEEAFQTARLSSSNKVLIDFRN